jgi:hypothetical protein
MIGPDQLSMFSNTEKRMVPTLVTSMYDQNIVDHNVFSVYFQPVSKDDVKSRHINGELVFGGGRYTCIYMC